MKRVVRIGFLMTGLRNLKGGGGTERFFADVFEHYRRDRNRAFELFLITDADSLGHLQDVGRLKQDDGVLLLRPALGPYSLMQQAREFRRLCRACDFDIVHVPLASPRYLPLLWLLRGWRVGLRPKLSMTVVDCSLADIYFNRMLRDSIEARKVYWLYRLYFGTVPLDGIYSWYKRFAQQFSAVGIFGKPPIICANYCFVDVETFRPAPKKENLVVFAARLIKNKRPLLFLEGVRRALDRSPDELRDWQFEIYGKGSLENRVIDCVETLGLTRVVTLSNAPSLAEVYSRSKLYVSTQDYDNFTSLSMLEAMSAGNAVIARDVGQTRYFVRHGENGYLFNDDSPEGLADAILAFVTGPERHVSFASRSREIATKEHCVSNFLDDIDSYWRQILDVSPATTMDI